MWGKPLKKGRKKQWYEHFKNLLGTPFEDTTLSDVHPVLYNVEII